MIASGGEYRMEIGELQSSKQSLDLDVAKANTKTVGGERKSRQAIARNDRGAPPG